MPLAGQRDQKKRQLDNTAISSMPDAKRLKQEPGGP